MDKQADEISQPLDKFEIDLKRKSKILCVTMFNAWLHCIQFKLEFKLMKLFLLKGGVTNNSLIITNVLGSNQPKATEDLQHIRKAQSKKRDNYVRVAKLHAYAITFFRRSVCASVTDGLRCKDLETLIKFCFELD